MKFLTGPLIVLLSTLPRCILIGCVITSLHSTLEHLKRWLVPEKVALSAEELECLLLPSLSREQTSTDQSQSGPEAATQNPKEDKSPIPEK